MEFRGCISKTTSGCFGPDRAGEEVPEDLMDSIDILGRDCGEDLDGNGGGGTTNRDDNRLARLLGVLVGVGAEGGRKRTTLLDFGADSCDLGG